MMMKGAALAADIKRNLGVVKERVLEKLAAAAVLADALESVVRDVTVAAHGLTKDALLRIKTVFSIFFLLFLLHLLPRWWMMSRRRLMKNAKEKKEKSQGMMIINSAGSPHLFRLHLLCLL
ncbi:uncharacterized protein LOC120149115 [Hibiscus syriacus]|uniref:uncharacterized protein LOC120149115 n=1 Tax=Hibiscus syriacus TaxID=106335 RepID=UPI001924C3EA|nr:uncharacterized protein LOC120149115 [Hibiscus syriacus]